MPTPDDIKQTIRRFLAENVLGGNESAAISDDTELIESRLIDSIVALKLVNHLEETYKIEFEAHEVDQENLSSINVITAFVQTKMK